MLIIKLPMTTHKIYFYSRILSKALRKMKKVPVVIALHAPTSLFYEQENY